MKIKLLFTALLTLTFSTLSFAADNVQRLAHKSAVSANVLRQIMQIPDRSIPLDLLHDASCIATIPNVVRAGLVFGVRYGKGLVSCRTAGGLWSNPSFITIAGGSWGAQIGIETIDLVLVFVGPNSAERFTRNNFTLGADASVAAGPLGRDAQAGTDYKLNSEIYSYSRTRGLFAGLVIEGSKIEAQAEDNAIVYGNQVGVRDLLMTKARRTPAAVNEYLHELQSHVR